MNEQMYRYSVPFGPVSHQVFASPYPATNVNQTIKNDFQMGGKCMFEADQHIVNDLLKENREFRWMYTKHDQLNRQVDHANRDLRAMDDFSLENLKKEKLLLKDKMAALIESHRQSAH